MNSLDNICVAHHTLLWWVVADCRQAIVWTSDSMPVVLSFIVISFELDCI